MLPLVSAVLLEFPLLHSPPQKGCISGDSHAIYIYLGAKKKNLTLSTHSVYSAPEMCQQQKKWLGVSMG